MDGNMLLEFSSSQFYPILERDTMQFLHEVSNAQLSPEMNDSSNSRDGMPLRHQIMANANQFHSTGEINNGVHSTINGANIEATMDKPILAHYRECMKNHAATLGGHSLDGCGEFIPSGTKGLDAFKCAACSCHRNFHRKEVNNSTPGCCVCGKDPKTPSTPTQVDIAPTSTSGGIMLPFDSPHVDDPNRHPLPKKKRNRTIFTLDQKEKMFYFAESLGWKILKHDEQIVQRFCDDVGVSRRIFRVWMHNHKHSMKI